MRILLANEPHAYRDVLAAALQALRPTHEVIRSTPEALEAEVVRCDPQLVLCSQLTPSVEQSPRAWVLLYPEGQARVVRSMEGQQTMTADLEFDQLLAFIDQAAGRLTEPAASRTR